MLFMPKKISFSKARKIILSVILSVGIFAAGYYFGVNGYKAVLDKTLTVTISRRVPDDKNVDMGLFWQVWDLISEKYYDKTKLVPSQMIYGAIEGMVSSVGDPYTTFLIPSQNKVVNEDLNGSFGGVGIEIGYKDGYLAVIAPLPGTPADKAGVKAGDFIIKITDAKKDIDLDSSTMSTTEAVTYIRGVAGTKVTLTLMREGINDPIVVDLVRETIDVPSTSLAWVGENLDIAKIEVTKFGSETKGEWDEYVSEILSKKEAKGLIIDLRNNPGGYMQAAIDLASDFVLNGTTIVIQEKGNGDKEEYKSTTLPRLDDYQVVILINQGSASASEILAGALRDQANIKLVGETSFGKGTIQEPVDMTGGSGVHVTTAKWLTPKGTWVHGSGLVPDLEITDTDDTEKDEQLDAAIKLFN